MIVLKLVRRNFDAKEIENPYKAITRWFDNGNSINTFFEISDSDKIQLLYKVEGLHALVKKYYKTSDEKQVALMMEFVLHGLAAHSLISKKVLDRKIEFKDLMGSMLNITSQHFDADFTEDDF